MEPFISLTFLYICARVCVSFCVTHLDERDISASWQMAGYFARTSIDSIQWKSLHYVACDSWFGTKFSVRGNCPSKKSIRMEWGNVYQSFISILVLSLRAIFYTKNKKTKKRRRLHQIVFLFNIDLQNKITRKQMRIWINTDGELVFSAEILPDIYRKWMLCE